MGHNLCPRSGQRLWPITLHGLCRYPQPNQAILTQRKSVVRMPNHIEGELSVLSGVPMLAGGRTTFGKATEDERFGVEGQFRVRILRTHARAFPGLDAMERLFGNNMATFDCHTPTPARRP